MNLTPEEAQAMMDLIDAADAMADLDVDMAEIERLAVEEPLPDDEARKLYAAVQAGMVRALGDPAEDTLFQAHWRARITDPAWVDNIMGDRARRIERGEPA